jgi:hypothetical protein
MKFLAHFVPRAGANAEFESRMFELADGIGEHGRAQGIAVEAFERLADDPFGRHTPYRFTLELTGGGFDAMEDLVSGLGAELEDVAHPDLSTLLAGEDVAFVPAESAHAYLDRYREVHSAFGLKTPGILGYVQFHVDLEASRRLAYEAQLGVWGFDSVSELHLESVETFLAAVAKSEVGAEAVADEERFVDRARSVDFCSRVVR